MEFGAILILILMLLTVIVLVAGIVLMASGGKLNEKYGNALMRWRIMLQMSAVFLLALMFFIAK